VVFNNSRITRALTHNKLNLELNGRLALVSRFRQLHLFAYGSFAGAIDTNLRDPGFVTVPLANGKTASYRTGIRMRSLTRFTRRHPPVTSTGERHRRPFKCFYSPFIAQNNQYTSAASALYQGGIVEVKKQFNKTTASQWRIPPSSTSTCALFFGT